MAGIDSSSSSQDELDRLKVILRTVSSLEGARLISFEDCELAIPSKSDQVSLVASLPSEISDRIKFRNLEKDLKEE